MSEFLDSMTYPFLACMILTGIHVYLGIHVIQRKVIFVDLALATIAALGAVWGALLGWDVHENMLIIKGFSLAFTIAGAALFSLTRMRHEKVPHEAFIGITYAVALAAIILGSSKLPHGAEELRELQAGSILWISGATIGWTALLYALIGVFHYVFRRQFFAISRDPAAAEAAGMNVRFWDFLFYVSFGFVVTSSVSIAGVLLVFSYLVIPSVIAILFAQSVRARLTLGWIVGTLVSASGVTISYYGDLPSGPVIVVCFGAFLLLAGIIHFVGWADNRGKALVKVVAYAILGLAFIRGTMFFERTKELELAHLLAAGSPAERMIALAELEANPEEFEEVEGEVRDLLANGELEVRLRLIEVLGEKGRTEFESDLLALLSDEDDNVRESAIQAVRELGDRESADAVFSAASGEEDEYLRVELAETLLEFGDTRGIPILLALMESGEARGARRDAFEHFEAHVASGLPYDRNAAPAQHRQEIAALRAWWEAHRDDPSLLHPTGDRDGSGE